MTDAMTTKDVAVCAICGHEAQYLGPHVQQKHEMLPRDYAKAHPGHSLWAPGKEAVFHTGAAQATKNALSDAAQKQLARLQRLFYMLNADRRTKLSELADGLLTDDEREFLAAGKKRKSRAKPKAKKAAKKPAKKAPKKAKKAAKPAPPPVQATDDIPAAPDTQGTDA